MSLKRFGVSLEDNLLESLDQYVNENGFANRSQAIRFLVEKNVAEKKWQCNHIVAGTIILMYDQVKKEYQPSLPPRNNNLFDDLTKCKINSSHLINFKNFYFYFITDINNIFYFLYSFFRKFRNVNQAILIWS